MVNFDKAINGIIEFKKTFDGIDPKIPKKLLSNLGEYYVSRELEKQGFSVEQKGVQAGYDIFIQNIGKRVEVRTSLLKNEGLYPKGIMFYGWRVLEHNQKENKFDYLIGVAMDDGYEQPKFYIFTQKEALSVEDIEIKRFNKIKKKIHLFQNLDDLERAKETRPQIISEREVYINKNQNSFLDRWDKIKQ